MSIGALPLVRVATLLIAPAMLAGCGQAPESVAARDGDVTVAMDDYRFHPQSIRSSTGRVSIRVTNRGLLPHALRLRLDGRERLSIPTVLPGRTRTVTARLRPGSYRMYCPIGNHEELGMYGTFVVR